MPLIARLFVQARIGSLACTGFISRHQQLTGYGRPPTRFFDSADAFHLPEDPAKPMNFVCAGTRLRPMGAFLWERLAMKHSGVSAL
jgi:sulfite reductase alpha subunit-like flavoprotein